jgi:ectoine hydroxylase-related dioxygenase (phytanoyl-CoA dioxygenase family)
MDLSKACDRLTDEQIATYHREGFLALEQITDAEDRAAIEALLMELFGRHAELPAEIAYELGNTKDDRGEAVIPQIIGPSKLAPTLLASRYFANARAIARQLLGADCAFKGDHAIYKPPHNNKETPWHQDQAYYAPGVTAHVVNFWMPLRAATVENGCMQFIPRSHLGDLLPHHRAGHDPKMHTLETDAVDRARVVACPLPAGGATLHALKTLHYTGPNVSDQPRPAYILAFGYEWAAE